MNVAIVSVTADVRAAVASAVEGGGYRVTLHADVRHALNTRPDAVFAEWPLVENAAPLLEGLALAQRHEPRVPIIVLLPRGLPVLRDRAVAAGAADVLHCPVDEAEIVAELRDLFAGDGGVGISQEKRTAYATLREEELVGNSPVFQRCLRELKHAIKCDANVLLMGETGTGKEMFARAIHNLSRRAAQPYVAVNCASLPMHLLESELFGHVRGAFTGAERQRVGRFESAAAGTLLLDEVGDIEPSLQMKLLRVIETREFERVGDNKAVRFNARLVAATSVDLNGAMREGRFRADLMGRLDQFRITLPPLRERREDIPMLANMFVRRHAGGRRIDIGSSTMDLLQAGDYPMNVRQLENALVAALARVEDGGILLPKHLPPDVVQSRRLGDATAESVIRISGALGYEEARAAALAAVDRLYLGDVMRAHRGNQSAAAEAVGIDRKTFALRWRNARTESIADE